MVAGYALISFLAAVVTAGVGWSSLGAASLLIAPFSASAAVVLVALTTGRRHVEERRAQREQTDRMVSDLRAIAGRSADTVVIRPTRKVG